MRRLSALAIGLALMVGCTATLPANVTPPTGTATGTSTTTATSTVTAGASGEGGDEGSGATIAPVAVKAPPKGCAPTDQDRYVYNPARLQVVTPCLLVTGTVAAIRTEADGDLHILIALDAAYTHLLRPTNQGEELGDLVVEPVCERAVSQADAVPTCAGDHDPLTTLPGSIGAHIWLEGRYVYDLQHGGWAELHPLYRWGAYGTQPPVGPTPKPVPTPAPGTAFSVRITSLTTPISRGAIASLQASTRAGADCTITVQYKSGPSKAAGLGPQTAGPSGALLWSWKIGTNTTFGRWPVTVRCSAASRSASATTYLTVN
jgi:hypothetical protein